MFKPIRWNTFIRDFIKIQIGFAIFGVSIALMIRAELGTGTWSVFEVAVANLTGLTVGTLTVIVGFCVLVPALLLREQVGWGTLGNILSIGPWLDMFLGIIPELKSAFFIRLLLVCVAIFAQGIASAIYIGVNAGAGPRDSLMLAIHRTTKLSIRMARASVEITVLIVGWYLGGPVGIGTLLFAFGIGPAVQWAFKLFNVRPHQTEEPDLEAV
jgi:uncharacterized membrane protein YczE